MSSVLRMSCTWLALHVHSCPVGALAFTARAFNPTPTGFCLPNRYTDDGALPGVVETTFMPSSFATKAGSARNRKGSVYTGFDGASAVGRGRKNSELNGFEEPAGQPQAEPPTSKVHAYENVQLAGDAAGPDGPRVERAHSYVNTSADGVVVAADAVKGGTLAAGFILKQPSKHGSNTSA